MSDGSIDHRVGHYWRVRQLQCALMERHCHHGTDGCHLLHRRHCRQQCGWQRRPERHLSGYFECNTGNLAPLTDSNFYGCQSRRLRGRLYGYYGYVHRHSAVYTHVFDTRNRAGDATIFRKYRDVPGMCPGRYAAREFYLAGHSAGGCMVYVSLAPPRTVHDGRPTRLIAFRK